MAEDSREVLVRRFTRSFEASAALVSVAGVLLLACGESASRSHPTSAPVNDAEIALASGGAGVAPDGNGRLRAALEGAAADPGQRDQLHLVIGCRQASEWRSMEVFEDGVAIWGGKLQFSLTESEITDLLEKLLAADFASMPPQFGGEPEPDRLQADSARTVKCSLGVTVAGWHKDVVQINRGEQSESFSGLVNALLDSCAGPAVDGIGVHSIEEGLEKVANGELAPVTFELQFQQLAEGAGAGEAADEFLLKIDARTVTTRLHDSAAGYSDPSTLELTRSELSELAWKLAEREPSRFRKNLWASSYADLTLRVLDQEVSLVARPYSGVDRGSHGGLQEDFDATVELLRSLHGRVLREGHGTALDS